MSAFQSSFQKEVESGLSGRGSYGEDRGRDDGLHVDFFYVVVVSS